MSNSLIFLPDISGFTKFVNQTEVNHGRHIITELLELLIDANELDLSLAEIEGDALFFYVQDQVPSRERLFQQVRKMFIHFHRHLQRYENQRVCQCGACCNAASSLNLKFIAHAGPLEFIQIKDQRKPFGKEVISAHRLMKNDVSSDEYLLLSEGLLDSWQDEAEHVPENLTVENGHSSYDFGSVNYQFFQLGPWRKEVPPPELIDPGTSIANPISVSSVIDKNPLPLYELISNLDYRLLWNIGPEKLDYEKGKLNRVGTKHTCVVNGKDLEFQTITDNLGEGVWVYGEKVLTPPLPLMQDLNTYFIIEEHQEGSQLTIQAHPKFPAWISWLLLPLIRPQIRKLIDNLMKNVQKVAGDLEEILGTQTQQATVD